MSRPRPRRSSPPALELLEAAGHLLRHAPAGALLSYYAGSIPGVLGLLYFWVDMSRNAFARERLVEASLGAALFYLWMKCWQAVFAAKLRAHLLGEPEAPWNFARIARLALLQIALQPLGLFLRPLAAQILIPYVWVYGFFQNLTVLGDGTRASFREDLRAAAAQAALWPRQAHGALSAIFGFAFFVWLNVCIAFFLTPILLKTFFAVETVFSRNAWGMLNTTTFAATLAATYLCVDPLRQALYVLRCFHGASLQSGEDLRVELKALRAPLRATVLALALFASVSPALRAAEPAPAPKIESAELNDTVERVLQRREYAWRLARSGVAAEEAQKSWLTTFFEGLWKHLVRIVKQIVKWAKDAYEWLRNVFDHEPKPRDSSDRAPLDFAATARWTLLALAAVLLGLLGVFLWRRRASFRREVAVAQPITAVPDLNEESVTADQLPEDGWLDLGRGLMSRGELRLALRAFYLAGLAHLHRRELILLARHKSNRDYDRELRRRARGNPELLFAFDANLLAFEAAWYGEHAVTPDSLGGFAQNLERMRAC